jgi:ribosomal protein L37E
MLWAALAGPVIAGLVFFVLGLRGRRIAVYPSCRRCGYTLAHVHADQKQCAECGAALNRWRAVRKSRRVVRFTLVIPSIVLMVASVAAASFRLGLQYPDFEVQHHKPALLLCLESNYGEEERAAAALKELVRRSAQGTLNRRSMGQIARHVLAVQRDPDRPWDARWGNLMEEGRRQALVTDKHWQRYAAQAYHVRITTREVVRVGDPVPFMVHEEWRVGERSPLRAIVVVGHGVLGDVPVATHEELGDQANARVHHVQVLRAGLLRMADRSAFLEGYARGGSPIVLPRPAAAGPALLRVPVRIDVVETNGPGPTVSIASGRRPLEQALTWGTVIASQTIIAAQSLRVVPKEEESVRLVSDPATGLQIAALLAEAFRVPEGGEPLLPKHRSLRAFPTDGMLPVPIAFKVYIREDGQEALLAHVKAKGRLWFVDGSQAGVLSHRLPEGFELRRMDLIFRPCADIARHTVEISEIWGEEIVVPDVVVDSVQHRREQTRRQPAGEALPVATPPGASPPTMPSNGRRMSR